MRPTRPLPALLATLGLALAGCATNPVTGESELALVSEQQEIAMGQQGARQAAQAYGLVDDPELQAYVARLGKQLAARSERPNLPWSFAVVDDPTPNAFALPGGPIFVTRGLLALMNSEAELVTVLGHEIGHVTARHSVSQLSKQQLATLGLGLGMILGGPAAQGLGDLAGQGMQLLFLKYGRDDERQADELGFKYALAQGYDVRAMANTFRGLQRSGELATGGRSTLPAWASSHPAEPERIEAVNRRVAGLGANYRPGRVGREEFLAQVDDLPYGDNPRQGYFANGTFYHPELKFQFSLPPDWQKRNTTQAVLGVSAQKNAAVQLTLAEGRVDPEQAAQAFLSQEGIQSGGASRQNFNGVPAVVGLFQAQSQQGPVQGYAAFLGYGGLTYRFVAYTSPQTFQAYDATFRQILSSFRPVTDPKVLGVQPQRLDVVKLARPTTLAAFAKQQGDAVPLAELAVINGVEDPNATIPAGTALKRVVGTRPR